MDDFVKKVLKLGFDFLLIKPTLSVKSPPPHTVQVLSSPNLWFPRNPAQIRKSQPNF